jgi:ABC-type sugar transport system permease subunit
MILTALVVFIGGTIWTIVYSFTKSKLLPRAEFVGLRSVRTPLVERQMDDLDREPDDLWAFR